MIRLTEIVKFVQDMLSASRTNATYNSTGIDVSGFKAATFVVNMGAVTGALDVKVQESDDNSNWADITGAAIVQLTAANKLPAIDVRLGDRRAKKKYLRTVSVVTTTSAVYGITCCLYDAENTPVTQAITPVQV